MNGKAYLGVSVYTNSEVKVKGEGWGVATNGVIEVPAPCKHSALSGLAKRAVDPAIKAASLAVRAKVIS